MNVENLDDLPDEYLEFFTLISACKPVISSYLALRYFLLACESRIQKHKSSSSTSK